MSERKVRVRFALVQLDHCIWVELEPLCIITYLLKNKGDFILRIEDTDQARYVNGQKNI